MITTLLARVKDWVLATVAMLALIGGAFFMGRMKGERRAKAAADADKINAENAALRESLDAAKERNSVEMEIDRMPAGASADSLRNDWSRD